MLPRRLRTQIAAWLGGNAPDDEPGEDETPDDEPLPDATRRHFDWRIPKDVRVSGFDKVGEWSVTEE